MKLYMQQKDSSNPIAVMTTNLTMGNITSAIANSKSHSVTNFENMVFHIFSSPTKTLAESICLIRP